MTEDLSYDDGLVVLDADAVILRRYWFPLATSRRIPYTSIRRVEVRQLALWTGGGRLWGTSSPGTWFPLDVHRPQKSAVFLVDVGRRVRPAFTPTRPDRVVDLLRSAGVSVEQTSGSAGSWTPRPT